MYGVRKSAPRAHTPSASPRPTHAASPRASQAPQKPTALAPEAPGIALSGAELPFVAALELKGGFSAEIPDPRAGGVTQPVDKVRIRVSNEDVVVLHHDPAAGALWHAQWSTVTDIRHQMDRRATMAAGAAHTTAVSTLLIFDEIAGLVILRNRDASAVAAVLKAIHACAGSSDRDGPVTSSLPHPPRAVQYPARVPSQQRQRSAYEPDLDGVDPDTAREIMRIRERADAMRKEIGVGSIVLRSQSSRGPSTTSAYPDATRPLASSVPAATPRQFPDVNLVATPRPSVSALPQRGPSSAQPTVSSGVAHIGAPFAVDPVPTTQVDATRQNAIGSEMLVEELRMYLAQLEREEQEAKRHAERHEHLRDVVSSLPAPVAALAAAASPPPSVASTIAPSVPSSVPEVLARSAYPQSTTALASASAPIPTTLPPPPLPPPPPSSAVLTAPAEPPKPPSPPTPATTDPAASRPAVLPPPPPAVSSMPPPVAVPVAPVAPPAPAVAKLPPAPISSAGALPPPSAPVAPKLPPPPSPVQQVSPPVPATQMAPLAPTAVKLPPPPAPAKLPPPPATAVPLPSPAGTTTPTPIGLPPPPAASLPPPPSNVGSNVTVPAGLPAPLSVTGSVAPPPTPPPAKLPPPPPAGLPAPPVPGSLPPPPVTTLPPPPSAQSQATAVPAPAAPVGPPAAKLPPPPAMATPAPAAPTLAPPPAATIAPLPAPPSARTKSDGPDVIGDWRRVWSAEKSKYYYSNSVNGKTTWKIDGTPFADEGKATDTAAAAAAPAATGAAPITVRTAETEATPDVRGAWKRIWAAEKNKYYYVNLETNKTQWKVAGTSFEGDSAAPSPTVPAEESPQPKAFASTADSNVKGDWKRIWSPEKNKFYYVHLPTGRTTWKIAETTFQ